MQRVDERGPPPCQVRIRPGDAADADVEDVSLGEVPPVAHEVGLDVELRRAPEIAERGDAGGRKPRLALLRDHDLFLIGRLPERLRDRAPMAAGSDDDGGAELALLSREANPVRLAGDRRDTSSLANIHAGRARTVE